jgi:hypothetical protein
MPIGPTALKNALPGMASPLLSAAQAMSLSAFIGTARTTFRAGLALIVIGSPVNGFLPGFALQRSTTAWHTI